MEFSIYGVYDFIVTYKWWLAPIGAFVIAFMVIRARG